ncbi:MAG: response regulator [Chitinivibrionales bacterium]|nr:response regulator [Chitinivibrionales bacterium]MBD3357014.1 response regulator [Chitinivibrionales bacterium]
MPRVLIIDDSWLVRHSVFRTLSRNGYEAAEATGGAEGISMFDTFKPDCVILDLLMPDKGGYEVMKEIKGRRPDCPVLILSADIQETTQKRCADEGADGFIQKPPKEEALLYTVKQAIEPKGTT